MIARTIDALLQRTGVSYDLVHRTRSRTICDTCRIRRIPRNRIATPVAIVDDRGHALAIILKSRRIDLQAVNAEFDRSFVLTSRDEIQRLFPERPPRAIPPIGNAEDIETFLDQELVTLDEVYFETEDPRQVVRVDGDAFRQLFYGSWCGRISQGVDQPRETPRDSPGKAA